MRARSVLLALTAGFVHCGGGGGPADAGDAAVDTRATGGDNNLPLSPPQVFEGQGRFVGVLGPALEGDSLLASAVTSENPAVVIDRTVCTRIYCGFVAHVTDSTPNRGAAIPEPAAGMPTVLRLRGEQYNYSARLQVLPVDSADASSFGVGAPADAVYSSLNVPAGATQRGGDAAGSVRLAVLGMSQLHGTLDLSASGTSPGRGGYGGGAAPAGDGQGPLGGRGAVGSGGGGGNGTAGENGRDSSGGSASGMGGAAETMRWQVSGGSGGGASMGGAGGAGGGALALAFFGGADLTGAQLLVRGSDGAQGGGGGAGGLLFLSGDVQGSPTVDASGGRGSMGSAGMGGNGGNGRVRIHGGANPTVQGGVRAQAPAFDLAMVEQLSRSAMVTLQGTAAPNARVRVQNEAGGTVQQRADATAGADGRWSMPFALGPNANALVLYEVQGTMTIPSLSGTTVVVRGAAGARQVYSGALEIAYLQDLP